MAERIKIMTVTALVLFAFATGMTAAYLTAPSGERCQEIGDRYENNESFRGTMSCYPPGVIDVNISEEVEENAELECVCRGVWGGEISIFPITVSK